ncbi:HNH endonuclease signature motif containing protein [Kribbella speibonae]|nr:HNH endonuclease signature motif containing protein [Kribbella speibonae]
MDRPPELMSDAELAHALDQCDADLARTETRRLRLIAAMDESGYAERVRARDTVQYIEFRYRLDHSRAYRDVKLARALPKYAAVAAALPVDAAEGEEPPEVLLRPAQAEAIVTALEKVPTTVPVADIEFAEEELVRLARHLAPADLRKAAEQSRDILDTDGPEPEEDKAAARETLTLKTADRGVKFTGYLANENAELFRTFIFTGARPRKTVDGERDPRSREKRQADALTTTLTLAATALDAGAPSPTIPRPAPPADPTPANSPQADFTEAGSTEAGSTEDTTIEALSCPRSSSAGEVVPGFGAKANLTVTIDFEDLKAATADAIGHTVYSNGLSAATIRRLACDANVIPVVLGSNSEPLDVGRSQRLVTRAIRRALNTRDRGCVICNAPPVICDAHHLISWIDGGETSVDNLVLLCRRDHTDLHHGHWTITITNGQVHVTRPTWADPPPSRPHKPPDNAPLAHEPPGERPTPSEPSGGGPTPIGIPTPRSSIPAVDPWGETDTRVAGASAVPAAGASSVRPSRWRADESTRAEAARFAVWGEGNTNGSDINSGSGPPSFATV